MIKLGLSKDCEQLVVTTLNENHNHEVSQNVYAHLPRQRRMTPEENAVAADLLKLKSSKKLLQIYMHEKTGKVVTLRDVSNIKAKLQSKDGNDLTKVVARLKGMEGSVVEVFHDNEGIFTGLFFQDAHMRRVYNAFPKLLMGDATYKLTDLRMPLFLMLGIDGNGHSQVVAVYLTSAETAAALTHMLEAFKSHNNTWPPIEVIMTDKDMTERNAFSLAFPAATLQLCLFHTLRSFSREVTLDKMGIRAGQRDALLEVFNAMANARSEQQFDEQCVRLEEMAVPVASAYFQRNWLPVKHDVLRGERDHTAIINRVSKSTNKGVNVTDDDRRYEALLTPHAYGLVLAQVARRDAVKLPADETPVLSPEGPLFVTDSSCSCAFRSSHRLPCRHIFARRQMSGKSSFDATLADKRWTAGYSLEPTSAVNTVRVSETVSTPALTAHQKYRQAMAIVTDLANWCQKLACRSSASDSTFSEPCGRNGQCQQSLKQKLSLHHQRSAFAAVAPPQTVGLPAAFADVAPPAAFANVAPPPAVVPSPAAFADVAPPPAVVPSPAAFADVAPPPEVVPLPAAFADVAQPPAVVPLPAAFADVAQQAAVATPLEQLTMPPVMPKRGRPKGDKLTAIGLPERCRRDGPQKFRT
ncbi:hypothetical protein LSAT2_025470 [Lamellibrachia satsuma]|nr:hypothetical protein LSAT2_025470 [Lamellibrachia satsuma]